MGRKKHPKIRTIDTEAQVADKAFETDLLGCARSPTFGRYLFAKAPIKKGTMILKEKFIVAGPKVSTRAICLGCHSTLTSGTSRYSCINCNWPMCNPTCYKSQYHAIECRLFKEKRIQPPTNVRSVEYGAVGILRALMLKTQRPFDWKILNSFEHHNEERKTMSVWEDDKLVIKVIREYWNLIEFSEDEIHMVCGIFEVNGFEMGELNTFGGIFPKAAMIAHDCIPNAGHFQNTNDDTLEIIAVQDIDVDIPITMCYDCCLKGTVVRRQQLWASKYFYCNCTRCLDPSELGTHLGTLLCNNPACKGGYVQCHFENGSQTPVWKCSKCKKTRLSEEVDTILKRYQDIADNQLYTIKMKEDFLEECKGIFHPNHFIPFSVKFNLCMAYGHDEGYSLYELSQTQAQRKLEMCQDVLKTLNVLTPGYSTTRANILYEIQAAEVLISRNLLDGGKCSKGLIRRKLQHSMNILKDAITIFELCYPMQLLAKSANSTTLVELQGFIKALK